MTIRNRSYEKGRILFEQSRYVEAIQEFIKLLTINPDDDTALSLLANCQMHIPGQEIEALTTIKRAIGINPEVVDYFVIKALILSQLGKNKEGVNVAKEALSLDPEDYTAYGALALCLSGLSKWAESEKECRKALELNPDYDFAANLLTHTLRLQNKMEENQDKISSLLSENPEDPFTHSNAGWSALQNGDNEKAQTFFLEALRLDPCFEYARSGLVETFKVRSPFYRLYLKYCFFMQRFTGRQQLLLIIGFFVIAKVAGMVFTGPLKFIGTTVSLLYLLFVFWSWVAAGVGNFIILRDRFARHALLKREKLEGIFVGGSVTAGLLLLIITVFANLGSGLLALALIGAAFPFSMTFTNNHQWGKYFYGFLGSCILLGGALSFIRSFIPIDWVIPERSFESMITMMLYMFIGSIWMGVFGILRK